MLRKSNAKEVMEIINDDFMLKSKTARVLYHEYAENMPIIDYHCHISLKLITKNYKFKNSYDLFWGGDHHNWRLMCSVIFKRHRLLEKFSSARVGGSMTNGRNGKSDDIFCKLTDLRSFISYTCHEYFRSILCNLISKWVKEGEYPNDMSLLGKIVEDICYNNAKEYFKF